MIALTAAEAGELQDRLVRMPAARPASQTMAVSANASTSVTFTDAEKGVVLVVLKNWLEEARGDAGGEGVLNLKSALTRDLGLG